MRFALVLALLMGGCMGDPPAPAPPPDVVPEARVDLGAVPAWRPGQAWTYRTLGHWDGPDEVTVIAVPQADGHLMAAATQEQLVDEVAWNRVYYGPIGADHAPLEGGSRLLMFPLENGTTWEFYGVNVVAREATISWAGGTASGFRVEGASADRQVLIEYLPEVGHVSRFSVRNDAGEVMEGIELMAVSDAREWVYLERAEELVLHDPAGGPGSLRVVPADDAVLAWAVGAEGGHAAVVAPDARAPEVLEGRGSPQYTARWLEPVAGEWHAAITAPPDGWMYLQLHALQWTGGTIQ